MKQLNIFDECIPEKIPHKRGSVIWKLFVDGASRKNPGIAGGGLYLLKNDEPFYQKGFFLGHKTNNQAEYLALLLGIFIVKKSMDLHDSLYIVSDSELLIKHLKGEYKVKNPDLKKLFDLAFILLAGVHYSFCHVLREYNTQADQMANDGIDKRIKVPEEFIKILHAHHISL